MIRYTLKGGRYPCVSWFLRTAVRRKHLRTSYRLADVPEYRLWYYGFRLVVRRKP